VFAFERRFFMSNSTSQQNQPTTEEILEDQVIRVKRGRLNKFGFEPAWNSYYDYYLSDKYLKKPILKLEDISFHLFLRKNLNDDDPTWKMPSMRMMKRRLSVSQDKIEGMLNRLTQAHLLEKVSGQQKGDKRANVANTYILSDPIQNLLDFLVVAAAGKFPHPLREKWKKDLVPPVPESGTGVVPEIGTAPVPESGTHKHTSFKQTSITTNNVVVEKLTQLKIEKSKAQELAANFSPDYIEEKIELLEWKRDLQAQGKLRGRPIEDSAGWLVRAIEQDYQPPPSFKTKAQRDAEATEKQQREAELARQAAEYEHHQQELLARKQEERVQRVMELQTQYGTTEKELALWPQVLEDLKGQTTQAMFQTHLAGSVLLSLRDEEAIIGLKNHVAHEWVAHRLAPVIERALASHLEGQQVTLTFITLDDPQKPESTSPPDPPQPR
jgi:hypothetical protein